MRLVLMALLALAAACAPEKSRVFELGLIAPVSPAVEAEARATGMTVREAAPEGSDAFGIGIPGQGEDRLADWSRLRLLAARAAVHGRKGVFFALPQSSAELTSYPEEWQALARVVRETAAVRPILEAGTDAAVPFKVPAGVTARAWRFQGRLYILMVTDAALIAPIDEESLKSWRTLFEARVDARELLIPCGEGRCLPAESVVWLEGRLW